MDRIAQIAVAVFRIHAEAGFIIAFTAHQHFAKYRAVVTAGISHLPVQPAGIIRIRAAVKSGCIQR